MARRWFSRVFWPIACAAWVVVAPPPAVAECPQADLFDTLNTGWDQSTGGGVIPIGGDDDDWIVTTDASGGVVPRPAVSVTPNSAWLTFPNSQWIAADPTGPNGTYVYETCWCMDDDFANPILGFEIRADDQADVLLNGTLVASLPDGTFNDAIVPTYQVSDPTLFQAGQNCLEVVVENKYGVVTGFNMVGTVSADDALCCDCDPQDIDDDGSTGVDDATGGPIPSGFDDDEWIVTAAASGGVLPRPAEVIDPHAAWSVIPGTKWITADFTGPNGDYVYENCWCMDGGYQNPQLDLELLADDRADVFLNGTLIGSTPATNAFQLPSTVISVVQPGLFRAGENCVEIRVENTSSVVTGLDVAMSFTAHDASCCDCVDIPPDAEGWWPLDETVGIVADEVLNNHDGFWSEQFGTPPPPTPVPGMVDGALQLDGVDDYVRIPNDPGLNFDATATELTIDAWVTTPTDTRQAIVNKKGAFPTDPGYHFGTGGGVLSFVIADGTDFAFCSGTIPINDGNWHFVAVTLDRTDPAGIRLWVDGAIDTSCDPTAVTGSMVEPGSLYFGGDPTFPSGDEIYWEGDLDEIEIFRRALTVAEITSIYGAGDIGKCPLDACQDSAGVPVCEGTCDPGFVCNSIPGPAGDVCDCVPESEACEVSGAPTCGGLCPDPDQICVENAVGECECELAAPCEGFVTFPECDGICEDSDWICQSNGQRCHCIPPDTPCEQTIYPDCVGVCPVAGELCEPDHVTLTCKCPDDGGPPPCEGFATFPECNGLCDVNEICVNNGMRCHCEPEPHCGDANDPTCDSPCPDGFVCLDDGINCACFEDTTACEDTFYPTCGGDCPPGESCKNIPAGTNDCQCVGLTPACGDPQYPECNGACPDDQVCKQDPGPVAGCSCVDCGVVAPDPVGPVIYLASGGKIRWTPVSCALTYNLHRLEAPGLRDLDGDGLADDYGGCYQDDVIGLETTDSEEPQPGTAFWYLVNAENFNGETSLGTNSAGQERHATVACP